MYKLERIDVSEYSERVLLHQRLIELDNANEFWLLTIGEREYALALNSNIMIPMMEFYFSEKDILFIGLHDKILAVSCLRG